MHILLQSRSNVTLKKGTVTLSPSVWFAHVRQLVALVQVRQVSGHALHVEFSVSKKLAPVHSMQPPSALGFKSPDLHSMHFDASWQTLQSVPQASHIFVSSLKKVPSRQ